MGKFTARDILHATVSLVRAAFDGEGELPRAELLPAVACLATRHDILPLVAVGLRRLNASLGDAAMKPFRDAELVAVFRYQRLAYAYRQLSELLEDSEIPHIPLKGTVVRDYYPEPWYRTSCDVDVFVKETDLSRTVALLTENGYKRGIEGPHDVAFDAPNGIHIEIHFCLTNTVYEHDSVYDGVFETATAVENKTYERRLPPDVFYYHFIKHMALHFAYGGAAIRNYLDLYVMKTQLSFSATRYADILEKGGLLRFAEASEKLAFSWFQGAEYDGTAEMIEAYLLECGMYSQSKKRIAVEQTRSGKLGRMLSRIFLPYSSMSMKYPSLKRVPFLYPFYLVRRWCGIIFCGGMRRSIREISNNMQVSREEVDFARQLFEKLGIKVK